MPNKRSGWNPKEYVYENAKKRVNNPAKIDAVQNKIRPWKDRYIDDGALRLNDTENGEGNAIKKQRYNNRPKKTIDEILNIRRRK